MSKKHNNPQLKLHRIYTKTGYLQIHDLTGKYGDRLFKEPLLTGLKEKGYSILEKTNKLSSTKDKTLSVVFTRSDKKQVSTNILKNSSYTFEFRRTSKYQEIFILWNRKKIVFKKEFKKNHEQERIKEIAAFLCLEYKERLVKITPPRNRKVIINFNVGENTSQRLKFNFTEVALLLSFCKKNGYSLCAIKDKNNFSSDINIFLKRHKISIIQTNSFKKATKLIDEASFYVGANSGLSHYAVSRGKIVFDLFTKLEHGKTPLFETNFINHLIFFGDTLFSSEAIECVKRLTSDQVFSVAHEYLRQFISGDCGLKDEYSNDKKIGMLALSLSLSNPSIQKKLEDIKKTHRGIFFPDTLFQVDYHTVPNYDVPSLFINSRKFVRGLFKEIEKILQNDIFNVSISAKNCSLFYNTALSRGVSDVDLMTIHAPKLGNSQKEQLLLSIKKYMRNSALANSLPHQVPVFSNSLELKPGHHFLIYQGKNIFTLQPPSDAKNLEKYKARIKLRIIFNEISKQELNTLFAFYRKSEFFEDTFIDELKNLLKDKKNFKAYQIFVRKMEYVLNNVGAFGSKGFIELSVSKNEKDFTFIASKLMQHGIIYLSKEKLYTIWDLRRPQHFWFIPIVLKTNRNVLMDIIHKGLRGSIYSYGTFLRLKNIYKGSLSLEEIVTSLSADSFLIVSEAFDCLNSKLLKQENYNTLLSLFEKYSKLKISPEKGSNGADGLDKQNNLLGLLLNKSSGPIKSLLKYNLFVSLMSGTPVDISRTQFFYAKPIDTGDSSIVFANEFIDDLTKVLREYYVYQSLGINDFFIYEKRKELLFLYIVKGRSLMEGPPYQAQKVKRFLKLISIKRVLENKEYLKALLEQLPDIPKTREVNNFLPLVLLENEIMNNFKIFSNKIEEFFGKIIYYLNKASKTLDPSKERTVWNEWKRESSYQNLFTLQPYEGSTLVTFEKKYPVYFFKLPHIPKFAVVKKELLQRMKMIPLFSRGGYFIVSVQDFTKKYDRLLIDSSISSQVYKELSIGENTIVNRKIYKILNIVGEGNFSVAYLGVDKAGQQNVIKHSLLPLEKEVMIGYSLSKINKLFVKYRDFDPILNTAVLEYLDGVSFSKKTCILSHQELVEIFKACVTAYRRGIGYGDLNPNNLILTKNGPRLIDPAYHFSFKTSLLKDTVGLLNLIYFGQFKKRLPDYWKLRQSIVFGEIKGEKDLLDTIHTLKIPREVIRSFMGVMKDVVHKP